METFIFYAYINMVTITVTNAVDKPGGLGDGAGCRGAHARAAEESWRHCQGAPASPLPIPARFEVLHF